MRFCILPALMLSLVLSWAHACGPEEPPEPIKITAPALHGEAP